MSDHTNNQAGFPANSSPGSRVSLSDRVRSLRIQDRPAAQPVGRWWLPWVLCLIFGLAAVGFATRAPRVVTPQPEGEQANNNSPGKGSSSLSQDKNAGQPAGPDKSQSPDSILHESKGYVVPLQNIQVSPKVVGMVLKLNIKEGQRVNKGDVLAVLEKIEYEAQYDKIRALADAAYSKYEELYVGFRKEEIKQAEAELGEFKDQRDFLISEEKRNKLLALKNAISAKELDQSIVDSSAMTKKVTRLEIAWELMKMGPRPEKIDAAQADWTQLEAECRKAEWQLENCTVTAPISGIILTKKAEEGNVVNPAAFNIASSLCEMADLYNLEVDLSIAERDITKIFKGQKCKVRPEAFPTRTYWGTVSRLMPTADRAKASIPVRVKIHITSRLEEVTPAKVAGFIGFLSPAGPLSTLAAPPAFATSLVEPQAEYLRPDMGALVTFLNQKSEWE